jgi:hypothetical protein
VNTSCPRRVRPPLDTCRANDRRMYLLLATVTGEYQCDVRERRPTRCTLAQVFHSFVKDLFRESGKKNPVTLVRGPPVREGGDTPFPNLNLNLNA